MGGIGIYIPYLQKNISRRIDAPTTNQRCELLALSQAIDTILEEDSSAKFCIYTDSIYSVKCATEWYKNWRINGWKNSKREDVKNRDIIEPMIEKLERVNEVQEKIQIHYVKGHAHNEGNIKADILAKNLYNN
jgi:ribonuclease HI